MLLLPLVPNTEFPRALNVLPAATAASALAVTAAIAAMIAADKKVVVELIARVLLPPAVP